MGSSDAPTPQHASTSHIPMMLSSFMYVDQRTETPGGHDTPPLNMLYHACDGL
jgi:hypothetical protein